VNEENELETWRGEWQSLGGREGLTRELAARVAKDGRRIKRAAAIEVLAAALSSSASLWMAIGSHGAPVLVGLCAGIFLFNGVWLTRLFTLREGERSGLGDGLDAFVERTRRRLQDDLRWIAFARRATIGLGLALVPWSAWMLSAGWSVYRAEPWRAGVGFGGIVVILGFIFAALRSKRATIAAERERFEALVAERTLA
jgi:hypothetical protein